MARAQLDDDDASGEGEARAALTPLVVLDRGAHHVVVVKSPDSVVVAGRGAPRPTLLDRVQAELAPGALPVHRLDRGTSGCCAFATTPFGQQALSDAFRRHLVEKRYLCVTEGVPSFTSLVVDARLLRVDREDAKRGPLAWQTVDERGQRALTRLSVLAKGDGAALVLARPETGRMHQIRAHLAHTGFPIVGDGLYGSTRALAPHTTALFAWMIAFPRPEGGRAAAVASLPSYFVDVLQSVGIDARAIVKSEAAQFLARAKSEDERAPRAPSTRDARGATHDRPSKKGTRDPSSSTKPARGGAATTRGAPPKKKSGPPRGPRRGSR